MDINIFIGIFPELLSGIGMTLVLFFSSTTLGFVLASGLFALQIHDKSLINRPARFLSYTIRGVPLLVQLYIVYYGLGQFEWLRSSIAWPLLREAFWCAILTLSIVNCAFTAEIMRGAYQAVPKGLSEAGAALGMPKYLIWWKIIIPNMGRIAMPSYGNELILMMKSTALAFTITLVDVMGVANHIRARTLLVAEPLLGAALIYFVFALLISRFNRGVEKHLTPAYLRT